MCVDRATSGASGTGRLTDGPTPTVEWWAERGWPNSTTTAALKCPLRPPADSQFGSEAAQVHKPTQTKTHTYGTDTQSHNRIKLLRNFSSQLGIENLTSPCQPNRLPNSTTGAQLVPQVVRLKGCVYQSCSARPCFALFECGDRKGQEGERTESS